VSALALSERVEPLLDTRHRPGKLAASYSRPAGGIRVIQAAWRQLIRRPAAAAAGAAPGRPARERRISEPAVGRRHTRKHARGRSCPGRAVVARSYAVLVSSPSRQGRLNHSPASLVLGQRSSCSSPAQPVPTTGNTFPLLPSIKCLGIVSRPLPGRKLRGNATWRRRSRCVANRSRWPGGQLTFLAYNRRQANLLVPPARCASTARRPRPGPPTGFAPAPTRRSAGRECLILGMNETGRLLRGRRPRRTAKHVCCCL